MLALLLCKFVSSAQWLGPSVRWCVWAIGSIYRCKSDLHPHHSAYCIRSNMRIIQFMKRIKHRSSGWDTVRWAESCGNDHFSWFGSKWGHWSVFFSTCAEIPHFHCKRKLLRGNYGGPTTVLFSADVTPSKWQGQTKDQLVAGASISLKCHSPCLLLRRILSTFFHNATAGLDKEKCHPPPIQLCVSALKHSTL